MCHDTCENDPNADPTNCNNCKTTHPVTWSDGMCHDTCEDDELSVESGCTQCTTGTLVSELGYILDPTGTYDTTMTELKCEQYAGSNIAIGNVGASKPYGCIYGLSTVYFNTGGNQNICYNGGFQCVKREKYSIHEAYEVTEGYQQNNENYVEDDTTITSAEECKRLAEATGYSVHIDFNGELNGAHNYATGSYQGGCYYYVSNGNVFWNPVDDQGDCRNTQPCLRKRPATCATVCVDSNANFTNGCQCKTTHPVTWLDGTCHDVCENDPNADPANCNVCKTDYPLIWLDGTCHDTCEDDELTVESGCTECTTGVLVSEIDSMDVVRYRIYEAYVTNEGTASITADAEDTIITSAEECKRLAEAAGETVTSDFDTHSTYAVNSGLFGCHKWLSNINRVYWNVNPDRPTNCDHSDLSCVKKRPKTCATECDDPNANFTNGCQCNEGYYRHNPDGSISTDPRIECTNVCPNDPYAEPGSCDTCKDFAILTSSIDPDDIYKYNVNNFYLDTEGTPPSENEMLTMEECRYYMTGGLFGDQDGVSSKGEFVTMAGYRRSSMYSSASTGYGGKWESDWGDLITSPSVLPLGCSKKKHTGTSGNSRGFGYYNPGYDDLGNAIGRNSTSCSHVLTGSYELEGCIKKGERKQCAVQCWSLARNFSNGCNCIDGYVEVGGHCGPPCPYMDDLVLFDTGLESSSHCTNLLKTNVNDNTISWWALEQGPNVGYCEMEFECPAGYEVSSKNPFISQIPGKTYTPFYRRRVFCQNNKLSDQVAYHSFQFGNAECVPLTCNYQSQGIPNGYILCDSDGLHTDETCEIKCNHGHTESGMVRCDAGVVINTATCTSDFVDFVGSLEDQLTQSATVVHSWGRRRRRRAILRRFRRLRRLFRKLMQLLSGDYSNNFYTKLNKRGRVTVRLVPPQPKSIAKINAVNACDEKDIDLLDQTEAYEIPIDPEDTSLVCMGNTPVSKMILTADNEFNEYKAYCWDGNGWDAGIDVAEEGHASLPDEFTCNGTPFFVNSHSGDASCHVTSNDNLITGAGDCDAMLPEGQTCQHTCTAGTLPTVDANCVDGVFNETVCTETICGLNQYVSSHTCVDCPLGEVHDAGTGATSDDTTCTPCGQGLYRNSTLDECTECPDGSSVFIADQVVDTGGTSCVSCDSATHYDHDGHSYTACQTTVGTCDAGFSFEKTGIMVANRCNVCPGWQHSAAGDTSCTDDAAKTDCFAGLSVVHDSWLDFTDAECQAKMDEWAAIDGNELIVHNGPMTDSIMFIPSETTNDNNEWTKGCSYLEYQGGSKEGYRFYVSNTDPIAPIGGDLGKECDPFGGPNSQEYFCGFVDVNLDNPKPGYSFTEGLSNTADDSACTADACDGSTQTVTHGTVDCTGLVSDGSCTVTCDAGYSLTGGVSCPAGTITNDATCTPDICDMEPTVIEHGTFDCGSGLVTDASCSFDCNAGYISSGSITCTEGTMEMDALCSPCQNNQYVDNNICIEDDAYTLCHDHLIQKTGYAYIEGDKTTNDGSCTECQAHQHVDDNNICIEDDAYTLCHEVNTLKPGYAYIEGDNSANGGSCTECQPHQHVVNDTCVVDSAYTACHVIDGENQIPIVGYTLTIGTKIADNTQCTPNACNLTYSEVLGCDSLVTDTTCTPSCPAGSIISDASIISCTFVNVLSSDPFCNYCADREYLFEGSCTPWSFPTADDCIGVWTVGDGLTNSICTPCTATEYENNGDNACTPWSFTAETCTVGNVFTPGSSIRDSTCFQDSQFRAIDPSDGTLDLTLQSAYCVNDVAIIGVTGITGALDTDIMGCIPCHKDKFLELYSIANLYASNPAYRRGHCCVNSHHRVCQQLMAEYKKKCGGTEDCPKSPGV